MKLSVLQVIIPRNRQARSIVNKCVFLDFFKIIIKLFDLYNCKYIFKSSTNIILTK